MNAVQSNRYLNSFLNLEQIQWSNKSPKWNLKRMRFLLKLFGHPEKDFIPVIIAGTKGKGSTGFFLESILKESGIKTGFYSSPHLVDPRERIRLSGKQIAAAQWNRGLEQIKRKLKKYSCHPEAQRAEGSQPGSFAPRLSASGSLRMTPCKKLRGVTYFEIMTLLAALSFAREKVQVGIFEVGMGGRLDATNALGAKIALITPIHKDHEAILGNTIAKIACEKAAVIDRGADVIVARQPRSALKEVHDRARRMHARLWNPATISKSAGLLGDYQRENAAVAACAARRLSDRFSFSISKAAIQKGIQHKNWPSRFEIVSSNPSYIMDGAHNPAAAKALARNLRKLYPQKKGILVFGTQVDKDAETMFQELSRYFKTVVLMQAAHPRAQETLDLVNVAKRYFSQTFPVGRNAAEALQLVQKIASPRDVVVMTGSFYLTGELRRYFRNG